MRFDKKIFLVKETKGQLLENGDYSDPIIRKDAYYANVSQVDDYKKKVVYNYDKLDVDIYNIIIRNKQKDIYNYLEYDNKRFKIESIKTFNNKQLLVVSSIGGKNNG